MSSECNRCGIIINSNDKYCQDCKAIMDDREGNKDEGIVVEVIEPENVDRIKPNINDEQVFEIHEEPKKKVVGGIYWVGAIVGFLVPIAGLVMYFMWKKTAPWKAKSAGIAALIRVVIGMF